MANKYWVKLYHEILDDPKMGKLPINLKWRFIECLLLAGELQDEGFLPPVSDIAWRTRSNDETVSNDLSQLAIVDMLTIEKHSIFGDERWKVVNFGKRQAPSKNALRQRKFQAKKRAKLAKAKAEAEKEAEKKQNTEADTDTYSNVINNVRYNVTTNASTEISQQEAFDRLNELTEAWILTSGATFPAREDKRLEWINAINSLLLKVNWDVPTAAQLMANKRQEFLDEGKTPYRPAAVTAPILADLDGYTPASTHPTEPQHEESNADWVKRVLQDAQLDN